jgi:hypothetical protein
MVDCYGSKLNYRGKFPRKNTMPYLFTNDDHNVVPCGSETSPLCVKFHDLSRHYPQYEGRLQSSWTHFITPSRNFVEVGWRSRFRSTSLGKRCSSYNAPPTYRKRAADRSSLQNFLPRSSLFTIGKAQKSHGARSGLYGGCFNGIARIHFFQAKHRIQFISQTGLNHLVLIPTPFLCLLSNATYFTLKMEARWFSETLVSYLSIYGVTTRKTKTWIFIAQ